MSVLAVPRGRGLDLEPLTEAQPSSLLRPPKPGLPRSLAVAHPGGHRLLLPASGAVRGAGARASPAPWEQQTTGILEMDFNFILTK